MCQALGEQDRSSPYPQGADIPVEEMNLNNQQQYSAGNAVRLCRGAVEAGRKVGCGIQHGSGGGQVGISSSLLG